MNKYPLHICSLWNILERSPLSSARTPLRLLFPGVSSGCVVRRCEWQESRWRHSRICWWNSHDVSEMHQRHNVMWIQLHLHLIWLPFTCRTTWPTSSTHSHSLAWHTPNLLDNEDVEVGDVNLLHTMTPYSALLLPWRPVEFGSTD